MQLQKYALYWEYKGKEKVILMQIPFHKQVSGLTVGEAKELNRLTLIYGELGPNGEVLK